MRKNIVLVCTVCGSRNYTKTKLTNSNKRFEIKKFCSTCNKHTLHKEA